MTDTEILDLLAMGKVTELSQLQDGKWRAWFTSQPAWTVNYVDGSTAREALLNCVPHLVNRALTS